MSILTWLKGVFDKMLGKESIQQALKVTPVVSDRMKDAIELWEKMYTDESPWLTADVHSLGIASLVASEKARMATLEMEVKITGEGEKADFIRDTYKLLQDNIRDQLEYGIALGGLVIKPYVVMGPDNKYKIKFSYTKATDFYPLSFSADNQLTSAAFVDRIITGDKVYSKLEIHTLRSNSVQVVNKAFVADYNPTNMNMGMASILGEEVALTSVEEWADIAPLTEIDNIDHLLFAYYKNPGANTVDLKSPLGVSGFSRAKDLIKDADEQYGNLLWEFTGGQLAVDVDRTALNPMRDARGNEMVTLPKLQDRLFRRNLDLGSDDMYNVFSPALRDASIINGLNNILMHIEDACCLARGTISEVTVSEARTATELKILKQRAFGANSDIQKELERVIGEVFNIIDDYCTLYNFNTSGSYEVAYQWDDSILVDKDSERQVDIIDVNAGLMSKVEYRMKWYGETENQAIESMQKIQEESRQAVELQQEIVASQETEEEDELNKKQRAIDSDEPNTDDETKELNRGRK